MAQIGIIRALLYEGPATTPELVVSSGLDIHVCSAYIVTMRRRGEVEVIGHLGRGFWRVAIHALTDQGVRRTKEADRARVDAELLQDLARLPRQEAPLRFPIAASCSGT